MANECPSASPFEFEPRPPFVREIRIIQVISTGILEFYISSDQMVTKAGQDQSNSPRSCNSSGESAIASSLRRERLR